MNYVDDFDILCWHQAYVVQAREGFDSHGLFQTLTGCATRTDAKTLHYKILYSGQVGIK